MKAPGLGLLPPDGRHDAAMAAMSKPMCAASDAEIPESVDYGDIISINDQGPRNSCCGNAVDKALEIDHYIETKQVINLSARFSYLAARTIDGTNDGPDQGAMIEGGARGAHELGCVLEDQFPYWRDDEKFDPTLPSEIKLIAAKGRCESICPFQSDDEMVRFIGTGQGAGIFGIWWNEALANYDGAQPIHRSMGGGSVLGGHALSTGEYVTINGEIYFIVRNSHGLRYGNRGRIIVHRRVLWNAIKAAPWGAWGITSKKSFTKRPFPGFQGVF